MRRPLPCRSFFHYRGNNAKETENTARKMVRRGETGLKGMEEVIAVTASTDEETDEVHANARNINESE